KRDPALIRLDRLPGLRLARVEQLHGLATDDAIEMVADLRDRLVIDPTGPIDATPGPMLREVVIAGEREVLAEAIRSDMSNTCGALRRVATWRRGDAASSSTARLWATTCPKRAARRSRPLLPSPSGATSAFMPIS